MVVAEGASKPLRTLSFRNSAWGPGPMDAQGKARTGHGLDTKAEIALAGRPSHTGLSTSIGHSLQEQEISTYRWARRAHLSKRRGKAGPQHQPVFAASLTRRPPGPADTHLKDSGGYTSLVVSAGCGSWIRRILHPGRRWNPTGGASDTLPVSPQRGLAVTLTQESRNLDARQKAVYRRQCNLWCGPCG